jgi:hypothetical protein
MKSESCARRNFLPGMLTPFLSAYLFDGFFAAAGSAARR